MINELYGLSNAMERLEYKRRVGIENINLFPISEQMHHVSVL